VLIIPSPQRFKVIPFLLIFPGGGAVLSLSLHGFALALVQRPPEAVGLRSRLDDIRAVSDTVDQRTSG
jgi:hypothetical protein